MGLRVFNTLGRKKQEFKPIKRGQVSMYTCGPTVYQYAHIGNLRAYLAADILRRVLEYDGYTDEVKHVINITDVGHLTSDEDTGEDKVEQAARRAGKTVKEITERYYNQFVEDLKALNVEMPEKFAWASEYIKEQIDLIKRLEERGYTYQRSGGIYFDVSRFKGYGKLGGVIYNKKLGIVNTQSRVGYNPQKINQADFALWKFSDIDLGSVAKSTRLQEWDYKTGKRVPFGATSRPVMAGYPGWHIECSAISTKELGQPFDIHTGGEDHIAIHHNDEIAQSEAAYGKPLAHYWFHNAFMVVNKAKMAKSAGNFYRLDEIGFEPMAFRYLAISSHYRQKLNFSKSALEGAQNSLNKLRAVFNEKTCGGRICQDYKKKFLAAVNDDLNMPKALAVVWDLLKSNKSLADKQATLLDFDKVLGLGLKDYKPAAIPVKVKALVKRREAARKAGDWKRADKLRAQIAKLGFAVEDTPSGPKISSF